MKAHILDFVRTIGLLVLALAALLIGLASGDMVMLAVGAVFALVWLVILVMLAFGLEFAGSDGKAEVTGPRVGLGIAYSNMDPAVARWVFLFLAPIFVGFVTYIALEESILGAPFFFSLSAICFWVFFNHEKFEQDRGLQATALAFIGLTLILTGTFGLIEGSLPASVESGVATERVIDETEGRNRTTFEAVRIAIDGDAVTVRSKPLYDALAGALPVEVEVTRTALLHRVVKVHYGELTDDLRWSKAQGINYYGLGYTVFGVMVVGGSFVFLNWPRIWSKTKA